MAKIKSDVEAKWLGIPEAARVYSVSPSLLRREVADGKLRTRRLYSRRLTTPEWLAEWFDAYSHPVEADANQPEAA